ncbi:MAG TPA: hypothetical protein VMF52_18375 [Steroidobacteraceae bacterium]|nr:hypothetical protein [Steroidobacteraceae bacterium]
MSLIGKSRRSLVPAILVVGCLLASGTWLLVRKFSTTPEPGKLVTFTSLVGEERAPSFSPDGRHLVFAWNGNAENAGQFDLYVKDPGSDELLRLTRAPARALWAAWSPDSKSIAFTRRVDGASPDTARANGVFVIAASGGAERRIAGAAFANPAFMQLSWSPDAKRIAYATYNDSGAHVLRIVDVETLLIQPLGHAPDCWSAGMPAFSADGRRLAFVCTTGVGVYGVYVANLDGGRPSRLATVTGEPQGLAWHADSQSLIVAADSGDGGQLWKLAPDGALTRMPFGQRGSEPARHGDDVAYVRARRAVDIWRLDLKAREPEKTARRFIASESVDSTPQYSPDGTRIVFQSTRSGSAEIWMTDAEGANPERLTQFNGPPGGAPRWCSDGKRVAFDVRANGSSAIWVLDIDEHQPRRLGSANTQNSLPLWSPDCRSILASDGRRSLFKLPVEGGPAELFTKQQSYFAQLDGDDVIFNVKQATGIALWRKTLAGGLEAALPGMPLLDYAEAWAVAPGAGVYYTTSTDGRIALEYYDFARQTTRRVAALAKSPSPGGGLGLAVSRDGRWLLYTQAGDAESDILVMDNP